MATRALGMEAVLAFAEHEHRGLMRGINRIHDVACEIGHCPSSELSVDVLGILQWLDTTFKPHIAWEEAWLYPEIDARTGTPWATRAARFDHQQIREIAARLRADQPLLTNRSFAARHAETRCQVFGLEALLRAHVERDERYLIPLLQDDRNSDQAKWAVARGPTIG